MNRGFVVIAFLGSLALAAGHTTTAAGEAQVPAAGGALTIAGRVLAADNGAVLRRARVEVSSGGRRFDTVLTDDEGRFASEVTGPGPFAITLSKASYVLTTITLSRDKAVGLLTIRLSRGAAVGGRVVDQNGRPAIGVAVSARPLATAAVGTEHLSTTTDDLGEFRLGSLPSGRYEVTAFGSSIRRIAEGNVTRTIVERVTGPTQTLVLEPGDDLSITDFEITIADPQPLPPLAALSAAQAPEPVLATGAAGRIRGRVVSESSQRNELTMIQLSGPGGERQLTSGPDGQFSIAGLRAGVYTLNTIAAGGVLGLSVQQSSRTIVLREDENIDGVELPQPRGGAVSGTIVDEHGEPVQGARVYALLVHSTAGRPVAAKTGRERRTDDRGRYRISGLPPGTYIVAASLDALLSRSERRDNIGYAPIYYPGTPVVGSASPLELAGDIDGVNMAVAPSPSARVRGRVLDGDGPLVAGTARLLVSRRSGSMVLGGETVPIGTDGAFVFSNVPAGDYVVQAVGSGPGRAGLFGRTTVAVADADPTPLTIETSRGSTLEGRFVVDGDLEPGVCMRMTRPGAVVYASCSQAPTFALLPVALDPDMAHEPAPSVVTTGTTFWVTGLFGPTAFALRGAPSDAWRLKSITIGGIDVTDGFDFGVAPQTIGDAEVVFTRASGTIAGRIDVERDAIGRGYGVVVFPTDRQLWFPGSRWTKFTRSDRDGSFSVGGLPAGDYFVAAVDELAGTPAAGEWQSTDVLTTLAASAIRASVVEHESRTVTTRLIRRPK